MSREPPEEDDILSKKEAQLQTPTHTHPQTDSLLKTPPSLRYRCADANDITSHLAYY